MGHTNSTILSPSGGSIAPPVGYETPDFPALYLPRWVFRVPNETVVADSNGQAGPYYDQVASHWLYYAEDIWHFTLYWHLIFHSIIFVVPALWFSAVALLSPSSSWRRHHGQEKSDSLKEQGFRPGSQDAEKMHEGSDSRAGGQDGQSYPPRSQVSRDYELSRRSKVNGSSDEETPANDVRHASVAPRLPPPVYLPFLPLVLMPLWGIASAVVMATIIGFSLSAVYNTAGFEMSTWIPFLCSVIEAGTVVITSFSTWTTIL